MHGQENTGPLYIRDIRLEAMAQSHKIYTQISGTYVFPFVN